jgi:protein-disulfide isomerase
MGSKQEFKERRRRVAARKRAFSIGLVVVGAVLVVLVLVWPNLNLSSVSSVTAVPTLSSRPPVKGNSMGNPEAPVKLDVWEDFQCSACLYFTQKEEPQLIEQLVATGKVYYTFHLFPMIDGGKGESQDSANAAMCASEQGRFWDYHDILFANWIGENAGSFTPPRLVAFAEKVGLDMTAFNSCFRANKHATFIQQDLQAGKQHGVRATPGIFVNDRMVVSQAGPNYVPSVNEIAQAVSAASGQ